MAESSWQTRAEARGMTPRAPALKLGAPRGPGNGPAALANLMRGTGPYGTPMRRKFASGGQVPMTIGPVKSRVAGRTDHIMTRVPANAFVIPADVVSGWGEGNTDNGHEILSRMFHVPDAPSQFDHGNGVDVALSGGELVVPPERVAAIGGGNINVGHKILDKFVVDSRKKHIKTLQKLPGPVK